MTDVTDRERNLLAEKWRVLRATGRSIAARIRAHADEHDRLSAIDRQQSAVYDATEKENDDNRTARSEIQKNLSAHGLDDPLTDDKREYLLQALIANEKARESIENRMRENRSDCLAMRARFRAHSAVADALRKEDRDNDSAITDIRDRLSYGE